MLHSYQQCCIFVKRFSGELQQKANPAPSQCEGGVRLTLFSQSNSKAWRVVYYSMYTSLALWLFENEIKACFFQLICIIFSNGKHFVRPVLTNLFWTNHWINECLGICFGPRVSWSNYWDTKDAMNLERWRVSALRDLKEIRVDSLWQFQAWRINLVLKQMTCTGPRKVL